MWWKIIGKVGYWATSILTVRTTVLSIKVVKTDLFPDLDIAFRLLAFGFWMYEFCVGVTVRLLCIIPDRYGVAFSRKKIDYFLKNSYVYNQIMSILLSDKSLLK